MSAGTLYVVATPLGHLDDLSPRAAAVLRRVAVVAAEDTRRTRTLLGSVEARPRLVSWHAHSTAGRLDMLLDFLADGQDVALVTDAGTPAISDPGSELVEAARQRGVAVVPIPGPSAVPALLSVAGLPADRYLFLGFLPRKGAERGRLLARLASEPWSVVLFEAPGRLAALLTDLAEHCGGERRAVVGRELTKLHEEVRAGTLAELRAYYEASPPRGEITVAVAGRPDAGRETAAPDSEAVERAIRELLAGRHSRKETVQLIAARFGLPRNEAYRLVMACE